MSSRGKETRIKHQNATLAVGRKEVDIRWVLVVNFHACVSSPGSNGSIQFDAITNKGDSDIGIGITGSALGTLIATLGAALVAMLPITVIVELIKPSSTNRVVNKSGSGTLETRF